MQKLLKKQFKYKPDIQLKIYSAACCAVVFPIFCYLSTLFAFSPILQLPGMEEHIFIQQ